MSDFLRLFFENGEVFYSISEMPVVSLGECESYLISSPTGIVVREKGDADGRERVECRGARKGSFSEF